MRSRQLAAHGLSVGFGPKTMDSAIIIYIGAAVIFTGLFVASLIAGRNKKKENHGA
jgi:hypothetical protein